MKHFLFSLLLLFLAHASLCAAPSIEATVNRDRLGAQDTLTLNISVVTDDENTGSLSAPQFPEDFPFQVLRQNGPNHSVQNHMTITNGHIRKETIVTTTYQCLLKPTRTGTLQIPAMEFTYGKTHLWTTPIRITVSDTQGENTRSATSSKEDQVEFRQHLSSDSVTTGMPVMLTYEFLIPDSVRITNAIPDFREGEMSKDFKTEGFEDSSWKQRDTVINGMRYTILEKVVRLTPKHPGTLEIPPCTITYRYSVPRQGNRRNRRDPIGLFDEIGLIDDLFLGTRGKIQENTLVAEQLTLRVEEFPAEGKPENFSGLLGPLRASADADLQDAYVGDPITLTLRLQGEHLNDTCALPDLKSVLENDGAFRVSEDTPLALDGNDSLTCTWTLRALSENVTEIPSLEIPYYDIKERAYGSAKTDALPLSVHVAQKVTLEDAHIQENTSSFSLPLPEVPETALSETEGIVEYTDQDALQRQSWSPFPGDPQYGIRLLSLLIGPFVLWCIIAIGLFLHRKGARVSPAERAALNARSVLRSELSKVSGKDAQDGKRLAEIFQTFLRQRLAVTGALTASDLQNLMTCKGYSPDQIKNAQELLAQCDAMQYGGATLSPEEFKEWILKTSKNL